jgi:drug/metabolite transporter (DMT)-like permease
VLAIVLAALSGIVWGTGDFAGGKATQRVPALTTVVLSKAASLPLLALYLVLLPATMRGSTLGWGALAGLCGAGAMVTFYRALAAGAMAVVAPVSAVTAALVPLAIGLATEAFPGTLAVIGAGCAILAIALVSLTKHEGTVVVTPALIGLALVSGAGFGLFFVFLNKAGDNAGLWPVLAAHTAALSLCGLLMMRNKSAAVLPRGRTLVWVIVAGVFDMSANVLYLLAAQDGLLSIVAPIASLYPVSTVVLAMLVDKERIRPVQLAGLGLAATALVLVAS